MNRAGLTSFLSRAQTELSAIFPASVIIAGETYACAGSRLSREKDLITGGWLNKWKVTFIIPVAAFVAKGKAQAKARDYLTIVTLGDVTPPVTTVVVGEAVLDATGSALTLRCESPEQ